MKVSVRITSARVQIANAMNVARQPSARERGAEVKNTSRTPILPKALWNPIDFCSLEPLYDLEIVDIPTGWKKLEPKRKRITDANRVRKPVAKTKEITETVMTDIPIARSLPGSLPSL
jgi:hypothetical protein